MCGIAGVLSRDRSSEATHRAGKALARVSHLIAQRGPDSSGAWADAEAGVQFAFRRLAIQDLSPLGAQPMQTADARYTIVFNGEIYNAPELRAELAARGAVFRGGSDTEVLLAGWAAEGPAILRRLRGMFALALWDGQEQVLHLARDPFGIKPLFILREAGNVWFCSSYRALVRARVAPLSPNLAAEAGFYLWGALPEPLTPSREISQLPAGGHLAIGRDGERLSIISPIDSNYRHPLPDVPEVGDAIRGSVRAHLLSDVPVGLLLSGGLDSGVIAATMADQRQDLTAVTLRFPDLPASADETETAAAIAASVGARHSVVAVSGAEFGEILPAFLDAMDMPSVDALNTWLACRAAASAGLKVVLSGVGGDELFGSYPSFTDVPQWHARFGAIARLFGRSGWRRAAFALTAPLSGLASPKVRGLPLYTGSLSETYLLKRALFLPEELAGLMGRDRGAAALAELVAVAEAWPAALGAAQPRVEVGRWETMHYLRNQLLRDSDWASMSHSVELRTPLVDVALHAVAAPVLAGPVQPKEYWYANLLNNEQKAILYNQPKRGFGTGIQDWVISRPELGAWRSVPALHGRTTPWTRRYGYAVWQHFSRAT
ncbi:MAG: asparagine synthase (glutamine-hydrolyzing) [Devosia sp.]